MGSEVTIIEYLDRIAPREDKEISKALEVNFKKNGVKILTSSELLNAKVKDKTVSLTIKTGSKEHLLNADIVLSAVGIKSNIENIGIEDVGIVTDKDKIIVDDYYQTNIPGYYAIGDITKGQTLAHVASAEGILCV